MIFSAGITDSARNASVRNGVAPDQPSAAAASLVARLAATTSASGASESRPATGSGHSAMTRPSSTTTMPPPISAEVRDGVRHVVVGHADDDEIVGVVGHGRGERASPSPEPATKPSPIRPVARCRSTTAILARPASASATARPSTTTGSRTSDSRHDLILDQPDRADPDRRRRDREVGGGDRLHADRLAHPVRNGDGRDVLDRVPALENERRERTARGREARAGRPGIRPRSHRGGRGRATAPRETMPSAAHPPARRRRQRRRAPSR